MSSTLEVVPLVLEPRHASGWSSDHGSLEGMSTALVVFALLALLASGCTSVSFSPDAFTATDHRNQEACREKGGYYTYVDLTPSGYRRIGPDCYSK